MVASSEFKQQLLLREYGRNIKRLVDYVLTIEDRQHRSESAQLLVNLMATLNPATKEINDVQQKLWNHLFVLSEGKLDVDAPFELSQMEYLNDKPHKVAYNQRQSKFKHYGQNVEKLIKKAIEIEDPEDREGAIISIGKLMKTLYRAYNKDNVTDAIILDNMRELSNGKLDIELEKVTSRNLFDVNQRPQQQPNPEKQKNYNTANAANQSAYFPTKQKKGDNNKNRKKDSGR